MQNRYVADFGDYVKLAILRALVSEHVDCRLGVAWWLFPDEHRSADGERREYLQRPNEWRRFDPKLFDALAKINTEGRRDVRALEDAQLLPNAVFANEQIPCNERPFSERPQKRATWLSQIKGHFKDCRLVFLDPDNGIAPEGLKLTHRRAGKSVTIEEITQLTQCSRPTVVYHQQTRRKGGHVAEISYVAGQLRKKGLRVSGALRAKPWAPRVFFILGGDKELEERAKAVEELWEGRISWHR